MLIVYTIYIIAATTPAQIMRPPREMLECHNENKKRPGGPHAPAQHTVPPRRSCTLRRRIFLAGCQSGAALVRGDGVRRGAAHHRRWQRADRRRRFRRRE